ncbi:MAG: penicillin-binding transpeptidase domain-containing protein [Angelakisella sp.]
MLNKRQENIRFAILGGIVAVIFILFSYRMTILQIAQGEMYKNKATAGTTTKQMVPAVRGEIVDRYGRPFTTNRVGYDIILDRSYLPYNKENDVLLSLMEIMEELGQEWIDNLPISETAPFVFKEGEEVQVQRLKKALGVNEYATAEECMLWLADPKFYKIGIYDPATGNKVSDYDPVTTRKLAGVRYEMVQRAFSLENTYVFASDVGPVARDTILERSYMLPGVDVAESPVREYVDGTLAPHILGTIGPIYKEEMDKLKEQGLWSSRENPTGYRGNEYIGKSGIEYSFESVLRGKSGERLITLDSKGNVEGVEETVPPTPGNTVVLTLDRDLQRAAQNALAQTIHRYNTTPGLTHEQGKDANAGAVVVQDPKTGEILAMANYPNYDISTYLQDYDTLSKQKPEPLINRSTMGTYRPGSIYKPAVATAGLAEGVITPTETINCTHTYTRFAPGYQPKCMYFDGPITATTALQRSCNFFFYETGWRLGIDRQNEYSSHFGLGQKTGIEIQEAAGQLSSPATREAAGDTWGGGYVIQSAIGQLDHAFTPVQMAGYVATLANDGVRLQPHLVKAIKSYDFKETVSETPVKEVDRVPAAQAVFDTVRAGMIAASQPGGTSARAWSGFPLTVASKTGSPEGVGILHSTYICYLPADDPQLAIAVVLENGGQGYTGAPVARLIADDYFLGSNKTETISPINQLLP